MGGRLYALIASGAAADHLAVHLHLPPHDLGQGFRLFHANSYDGDELAGDTGPAWHFLIERVADVALDASCAGPVAYVEADFQGGGGFQSAAVWRDRQMVLGPLSSGVVYCSALVSTGPANVALRLLGYRAEPGTDEWETARLRHRWNPDVDDDEDDDRLPAPEAG